DLWTRRLTSCSSLLHRAPFVAGLATKPTKEWPDLFPLSRYVTRKGSGDGAAGDDLLLKKAVNSNLPHAVDRAVERGVFGSADAAGTALRNLTAQITRTGTFPSGTLVDTARPGRFLVPIGNNGMAVYQLGSNGTTKLKTVLISK